MVVLYRLGLFLATLSFIGGIAMVIAGLTQGGLGLIAGAIIVLGSVSLIRGLRRRIYPQDERLA